MQNTEIQGNDVSLRAQVWSNTGTPLCLVHGGPGLFGYMRGLAEELAEENFPVWDYFQRDGQDGRQVSVNLHIEDLKAVVDKISTKPVAIAHSWGGVLSLLCQARFQCFSKIVLINAMPIDIEGATEFAAAIDSRLSDSERELRETRMEKLQSLADGPEKEGLFTAMSDDIYKTYQKTDLEFPFSRTLVGSDASSFFATHADLGAMMVSGELAREISKVDIPVHLIYGNYDPCPGKRVEHTLKELLPNMTSSMIEDCGHYPWLEQRKTWLAARSELLSQLKGN